ncbi:methyltransferase domain-containing protein [Colletotrichum asianum]
MADNQTAVKDAGSPAPVGSALEAESRNDNVRDSGWTSIKHGADSAPSILQNRLENGRTYHKYKDGKYLLSNDKRENKRLGCIFKFSTIFLSHNIDLQHSLYLLNLYYKLGLAPPNEKPSRAFGQLTSPMSTPEAESSSAHHVVSVPPNGKFEVDDIEQPWAYGQPLDYIHIRGMTSSISDWPAFVEKVYNGLASGCYIESFEGHARNQSHDESLIPEHAMWQWAGKLDECCKILGRHSFTSQALLCPCSRRLVLIRAFANASAGLEAWNIAALARALNWSYAEVQALLSEVRKCMNEEVSTIAPQLLPHMITSLRIRKYLLWLLRRIASGSGCMSRCTTVKKNTEMTETETEVHSDKENTCDTPPEIVTMETSDQEQETAWDQEETGWGPCIDNSQDYFKHCSRGEDVSSWPANEPQWAEFIVSGTKPEEIDDSSPSRLEWLRQKRENNERNAYLDQLMTMVGLENVKAHFLAVKAKVEANKQADTRHKKLRLYLVLYGKDGTGKKSVAQLYAQFLHSIGAVADQTFTRTAQLYPHQHSDDDRKDDNHDGNDDEDEDEEKPAVIFYDISDGSDKSYSDVVSNAIQNTEESVVIISSRMKSLLDSIESSTKALQQLPAPLTISDYDDEELRQIFVRIMQKRGFSVEGGFEDGIVRAVVQRVARKRKYESFLNVYHL